MSNDEPFRAVERVMDRTEYLEAKAAALQELEAADDIEGPLTESESINDESDGESVDDDVEAELAALKADLEDDD